MKNVIEVSILNGKFRSENILLPSIHPYDFHRPIDFKRSQLPIRLEFTKTIIKLQGQMMSVCGTPCFSHFSNGELYMACSRVGKHPVCVC